MVVGNEGLKHSPDQIQGAKLGRAPYSTVRQIFAGYEPPPRYQNGGHPRYDVKPILADSRNTIYATDYQVSSSFTPEQRPYITTVVTYLNALAQGRVFSNEPKLQPDFSSRMVTSFLSQREDPRFLSAFIEAKLGLLSDFSKAYPNLIPALSAMYRTSGTDGTIGVMIPVRVMLDSAIEAIRNNEKEFYALENLSRIAFAARHPYQVINQRALIQGPIAENEVWCSAEVFARTLLKQSADSAGRLALNPQVQSAYKPEKDEIVPDGDAISRIELLLTKVSQEVEEAFQKGDLK